MFVGWHASSGEQVPTIKSHWLLRNVAPTERPGFRCPFLSFSFSTLFLQFQVGPSPSSSSSWSNYFCFSHLWIDHRDKTPNGTVTPTGTMTETMTAMVPRFAFFGVKVFGTFFLAELRAVNNPIDRAWLHQQATGREERPVQLRHHRNLFTGIRLLFFFFPDSKHQSTGRTTRWIGNSSWILSYGWVVNIQLIIFWAVYFFLSFFLGWRTPNLDRKNPLLLRGIPFWVVPNIYIYVHVYI